MPLKIWFETGDAHGLDTSCNELLDNMNVPSLKRRRTDYSSFVKDSSFLSLRDFIYRPNVVCT